MIKIIFEERIDVRNKFPYGTEGVQQLQASHNTAVDYLRAAGW